MTAPEKDESKIEVFKMADKVGIKKEMIEALNWLIQEYKGNMPKQFGPEELHFMIYQGMTVAGVKSNPEIKSLMTLCRAFIHGYLTGKVIVGE